MNMYAAVQTWIVQLCFLGTLVVNWGIAWYVYTDGHRYQASKKAPVEILPIWLWALACGFLGILAFAVYWCIHYTAFGGRNKLNSMD
jgi:hypothetical protein